jgi:Zn-finger nucleic acid-binding protein
MRCPRDNQQLNRKVSERLYGEGCSKCDGIFLTGKRTQAFQHNIEKQLLENSVDQNPSSDSPLLCPDCNTPMNVTYVDNIEIDICHKYLGVWFDKTEAQAIIQKYKQDDNSESKTNHAPFPSEFVQLLSKWFLHKPKI